MPTSQTRIQVVFEDLRRAVDDVIGKHQVTPEELMRTAGWIERAAQTGEIHQAIVLFVKAALKATDGASYTRPEKDGASYWEMEGPAYLPDAPRLDSPYVLPMRPDAPGEPLFVSGTITSTTGDLLPGAVLDVWQIDANSVYSGLTTEDFGGMDIPNDARDVPTYNLRGKVVIDDQGRFEFRTVMRGTETLGFQEKGSPMADLIQALELPGLRSLHIHSIASAAGHHPLTTQIYFDGDPLVTGTIEGPVPAAAVKETVLHEDPVEITARGLDRSFRTLVYDYVLRPVDAPTTATEGIPR